MIYVFENQNNNASVVFDETTLTEEQKEKGIAVTSLPITDEITEKQAVLKCNKSTGEVWYKYTDKPVEKETELENRINLMQQALDELILGGAL